MAKRNDDLVMPWDRPAPGAVDRGRKLTPAMKAAARKRAKEAGRPYPNLVDNMAVLRAAQARGGDA